MMRRLRSVRVLFAGGLLLVASCGGDGASTTPTATAAPTPTPEPPGQAGLVSCAAGLPAGQVVAFPFVCIDRPIAGHSISGPVAVRGHVANAPGDRVFIEIRDQGGRVLA